MITLEFVARTFFAALFFFAGAQKIPHFDEMYRAILGYQFLPAGWEALGVLGAYFIPWIEVWCGIALFSRRFRAMHTAAAGILLGLTIVFTGVTLVAYSQGVSLRCGCFGITHGAAFDDYRFLFARSAGLLILGSYLFVSYFRRDYQALQGRP